MSFSHKVKKELSCLSPTFNKQISIELCAIFSFGSYSYNKKNIFISTENKNIIERIKLLLSAHTYLSTLSYEDSLNKYSESRNIYSLKINCDKKLFENYLCLNNFFNLHSDENFYPAFLRGIFISCGSITNPTKEYHLEFDIESQKLCDAIITMFKCSKTLNYCPRIAKRRNRNVIYLKENSKITDFLVFIGATRSAMELLQIKMVKEVRNNINRSTNFETANLYKTTSSSSEQIKAIRKIKNSASLESLPEPLKETALLRLGHPYISLKELASLHKTPVSKSGVNHRLKKIINISSKL